MVNLARSLMLSGLLVLVGAGSLAQASEIHVAEPTLRSCSYDAPKMDDLDFAYDTYYPYALEMVRVRPGVYRGKAKLPSGHQMIVKATLTHSEFQVANVIHSKGRVVFANKAAAALTLTRSQRFNSTLKDRFLVPAPVDANSLVESSEGSRSRRREVPVKLSCLVIR